MSKCADCNELVGEEWSANNGLCSTCARDEVSKVDTNQASEDIVDSILSTLGIVDRKSGHRPGQIEVVKQIIRTEKLKLLAEVRERVVDKPTGNHNADSLLERDVLIYNQATAYLRTELTKLEAEL